jgi:phage shock protein E
MINTIKKLFGFGPKTDYAALIKQGAIILDVRSPSEFKQGHIKGSINAPLNSITNYASKLIKETPVICCCASGMRSASAKNILITIGFKEVYNGGGWSSLEQKIK